MSRINNISGLTYMEILITLIILGITVIPLMNMFSQSLAQVEHNEQLTVALGLARNEMEKIKTLKLTEAQLSAVGPDGDGTVYYPPLEESPLEIGNRKWRTKRWVIKGTDPLEVHVSAFIDGYELSSLIELSTLVEDLQ